MHVCKSVHTGHCDRTTFKKEINMTKQQQLMQLAKELLALNMHKEAALVLAKVAKVAKEKS